MERDYGMISQRYIKLFNGLNKNLQQRVYELDRPVVEFAVRDVNTVTTRKKILTATVPVAQQESLSLSQKIISSNMKYRGMRVIESMSRFLADMNEQKKLTAQILLPVRNMTETHTSLLVPVIICESNNDKYGNKQVNIRTVDFGLTQKAREEIVSSVNAEFMKFDWQDETINSEIRSEFSKYLSASSSSQRVKDMANKLFMANSFQTIKKQQV